MKQVLILAISLLVSSTSFAMEEQRSLPLDIWGIVADNGNVQSCQQLSYTSRSIHEYFKKYINRSIRISLESKISDGYQSNVAKLITVRIDIKAPSGYKQTRVLSFENLPKEMENGARIGFSDLIIPKKISYLKVNYWVFMRGDVVSSGQKNILIKNGNGNILEAIKVKLGGSVYRSGNTIFGKILSRRS